MTGTPGTGRPAINKQSFGEDFKWGVAASAYQTEGCHDLDGKGPSIWDVFSRTKGKIYKGHTGDNACDFYRRYAGDLALIRALSIPNFRFSLSWPRLIPSGSGTINQKGIDFYNRLIDRCLQQGIVPWVTLYHWDLPYALEKKGGWTNRDTVYRFMEYAELCAREFGDRVPYWMVLNEPMVFTGAGYFLGVHAPGRTGLHNALPAIHHAALCQAEGARILKHHCPDSEVGTTFSCSHIVPYRQTEKDYEAAKRIDALLNRLFPELSLGLGYPVKDVRLLEGIGKYRLPNDDALLKMDFDFAGLQTYTREVVKYSRFMPFIQADIVKAEKRNVPLTSMKWEVYSCSIYHMLKKLGGYSGIKKIYITENGAAFPDEVRHGEVKDDRRIDFIQQHLKAVLQAKNEGVNVKGYFVWTLTDNFEWAEGFHPRFGLVYVDFKTQQRTVKSSGKWYRDFLA